MIDHNEIPSSPSELPKLHSDSWRSPGVAPALVVNILGGLMYGIAIGTVPIMLQFNAYLGECSRYSDADACNALTFTGCSWVDNFNSSSVPPDITTTAATNVTAVPPFCGFPDYATVNCSSFGTKDSCASSYPSRDGTTCVWRFHDQRCEHFVGWSANQQGLLAGMQIVGSMIAAATSGSLLAKFGRRRALMWTGFAALIACACLSSGWASRENQVLLVFAELFVGIGCGWACVVCPMYNEELVKGMKLSQTIGVLFQVHVTVGIFLVASIGFALDPRTDTNEPHADLQERMQYVFAVQWMTALLAIPVGYYVPESPVWLKDRKGKETEGCLCCEPDYGDERQAMAAGGGGAVGTFRDEKKRLVGDDSNAGGGAVDQRSQVSRASRVSSTVGGVVVASHGAVDDVRRALTPGGKTQSDLLAEEEGRPDPYAAAIAVAEGAVPPPLPTAQPVAGAAPAARYGSNEQRTDSSAPNSAANLNHSASPTPSKEQEERAVSASATAKAKQQSRHPVFPSEPAAAAAAQEESSSAEEDANNDSPGVDSQTDAKTAISSYYPYEDEDYDKDAPEGTLLDLFRSGRKYLLPLSVAVSLAAAQQLTGVNSIFVYAPILAGRLGIPPLPGNFYISLWNFITCLTAIPIANQFPARKIFIFMCGASAAACTLTAIAVYPGIFDEDGTNHKVLGSVGIAAYVWFFEIGLGPCFYVLACNIFPPRVRAAGASFAVWVNFAFNTVINWGYAPLSEAISGGPSGDQNFGMSVCCFFFAAVGLTVCVYLTWKMPKTDAEIAHEIAHEETSKFEEAAKFAS